MLHRKGKNRGGVYGPGETAQGFPSADRHDGQALGRLQTLEIPDGTGRR